MKGSILIIDDDIPILEAVKTILEDMGFSVEGRSSALEGERLAKEQRFDLVLVDLRMPEKDGAAVTRSIIEARPDTPVFVITGFPGDQLTQEALASGARGVLKKPFEIAKILDFFKEAGRAP
ncbi:MAG TPA: response regulator [Treponemataceae bacterium]|jgi:two-component system chemotaxis response regulator CheY|nr:response regulator [Treponemataceae bacterium]